MSALFSRFRPDIRSGQFAAFLSLAACIAAAVSWTQSLGSVAVAAIAAAGVSSLYAGLALSQTRSQLASLGSVLDQLGQGDFEARLVGFPRGEVGSLALAVNSFADQADAFVRESRASLKAVAEQRYHRRIVERGLLGDFLTAAKATNSASAAMAEKVESLARMADQFEAGVARIADSVASAADQLESTSIEMSGAAEGASRDAVAVAAAAEQASANVHTVAAAAEELSASISEISAQVARSRDLANVASDHAAATDGEVRKLVEAGHRIQEVVVLINDIASQTNLLALNATIEAARAGEAGKGFAVVANEVKALAGQTAKATEEITSQVASVQAATDGAIKAMAAISHSVTDVSEAMVVVASAVEEQGAATSEIARNVDEASTGTREVSSRIGEVTNTVSLAGAASSQVLIGAKGLSERSVELRTEIDVFLQNLRKTV